MRLIALAFVISLLLSYAAVMPADAQTVSAQYRIQTEDVLRLSVWGEPNLTGEHMVDPEGNINIALIGQMHVEGLTPAELIEQIRRGLDMYLVEPRIQLTISQFRKPKVHVLGEVNRPGQFEFKYGDRVMEAVAQGGSFRETANLRGAILTRRDMNESVPLDLHRLFIQGDMSVNMELMDGDTIFIPEDTQNRVFVLGEVLQPGQVKLKENMTAMDAISIARGPTDRGVLKGTVVIRGGADGSRPAERIKLDLGNFMSKADLTQNIKLEPGDVVYVPETAKPDWSKISQVVSAVFNTSYLLRILGL
ncbi:MAG: polysaccharide biosynthesis/export family protein [Armatimonadetes bacterium]|nr:polysaccharide biosynthesis/export family protein [Armatimonadota bacterium]